MLSAIACSMCCRCSNNLKFAFKINLDPRFELISSKIPWKPKKNYQKLLKSPLSEQILFLTSLILLLKLRKFFQEIFFDEAYKNLLVDLQKVKWLQICYRKPMTLSKISQSFLTSNMKWVNSLSVNPTRWSKTLKHFLSVFECAWRLCGIGA